MSDLKRLSKFVALMLRHQPDKFGLWLDSEGFADLDAVWQQVEKRYRGQYSRDDLDTMLNDTAGGRQRYQVVEGRVRAMYGHSAVSVAYDAVIPPEVLYHGTVAAALGSIRKEGLTGQKRQYVHLSTEVARATDVAGRHGKPVLLKIRAQDAHAAGIIFHNPEPQHYLVRSIPPEFIDFPD